jgi:archaellum component FlaF (FlaF/FlaG flagellin family)
MPLVRTRLRRAYIFSIAALVSFAVLAAVIARSFAASAPAKEEMTPLLLAVQDAPIPFIGSDSSTHLVYEILVTNFSSGDVTPEKLVVLGDGAELQTLEAAEIATRLQPVGTREPVASLSKSTQALLFVHVILPEGKHAPRELSHRMTARFAAAPPGHQEITATGGLITVDHRAVAVIGPPLHGEGYVSADSCCDAVRHTRATLPINGRFYVAQRYAVDWEQINEQGRIYRGPREKVESYNIFGKEAIAVADGIVASITDGAPEGTPGQFPTDMDPAAADGNAVILDLGQHRYAMYAHMQPGSIKVHQGDKVRTGQVLGLVGNTGNSLVPHLHFQLMDQPSSLASNGLPYEIDNFTVTARGISTAAFDQAEADGTPLPHSILSPPIHPKKALPLDQLIITFR